LIENDLSLVGQSQKFSVGGAYSIEYNFRARIVIAMSKSGGLEN